MLPPKAPKNASAAAAAPVEGGDRISNLPDCVLQHILSFLPAQDVVRTCVLAKRWRHTWESTTGLRFVCRGTKEELEFVDQRLRLQIREKDTQLETCEFRLCPDDDDDEYEEFDTSRMLLWIRIALQCKVRVLQLIYGDDCRDMLPISHPQYVRPIFISQHLKKLKLENFDDMLPRFVDFSYCPFLEDLEIVRCTLGGGAPLFITSQSLKRLTIQNGHFCEEERLPICCPNLVSLWLEVIDGWIPSLQRMPSLLTAFVKICEKDPVTDPYNDNNQSILLQSLSEVQNLVLISDYTNMCVFRRDLKFCSSFNKLKSLILNEYWCEPADFSALACLLKLSPVLEKLTLQLYSKGPKHKVEIKLSCKPLEMSAAISKHLKTLEVKCQVCDERIHNILTSLSKHLNIWFQFSG